MSGIFSTIRRKTKRRNLPWIPLDTIPSDIRASRKHDLLNSSESTATFPTNSSPCQGINCHCQFEQSEWKLPVKVTPLVINQIETGS